jgi:hypothetical protein
MTQQLLFILRQSPDWHGLSADFQKGVKIDPARFVPPRPIPGFPRNIVALIDKWNTQMGVDFFSCRSRLKKLCDESIAQIPNARRISYLDIDTVVPEIENYIAFYHDDDDWFAPDIGQTLQEVLPANYDVCVFPLTRIALSSHTQARHSDMPKVSVGPVKPIRYLSNNYGINGKVCDGERLAAMKDHVEASNYSDAHALNDVYIDRIVSATIKSPCSAQQMLRVGQGLITPHDIVSNYVAALKVLEVPESLPWMADGVKKLIGLFTEVLEVPAADPPRPRIGGPGAALAAARSAARAIDTEETDDDELPVAAVAARPVPPRVPPARRPAPPVAAQSAAAAGDNPMSQLMKPLAGAPTERPVPAKPAAVAAVAAPARPGAARPAGAGPARPAAAPANPTPARPGSAGGAAARAAVAAIRANGALPARPAAAPPAKLPAKNNVAPLGAPRGLQRHTGIRYIEFMKFLAQQQAPRTYLEVGTRNGESVAQVDCDVICVDPMFKLTMDLVKKRRRAMLFQMTSDEFFETYDIRQFFPNGLDLSFLDGMHLFEFLLRDFINAEKYCHDKSIILLHDCLPFSPDITSRVQKPGAWTGDVWKVLAILKKYRPDLKVIFFDCPPTGLAAVTNFDPKSTVLKDAYDEIVAEYMDVTELPSDLRTMYPYVDTRALFADPADLGKILPMSGANSGASAPHGALAAS